MGVTPEVIERDKNSVHFLLIDDEREIGCVSLLIEAKTGILRQMAISSNQRKKGLGRELVSVLEDYAKQNGVAQIELEARTTAVGFYLKQSYETVGAEYLAEGVSHLKMEKQL